MTNQESSEGPTLTVVIPTHDVGPWIAECLKSVLRQTEQSIEVIVVDDHSTDDTVGIVDTMMRADPRIRLVIAEDRGGANARNSGAALARGRYLIFADGDDIVPDNAYASLVESLEVSQSDMAVGNFLKFSAKKTWEPGVNWRLFSHPQQSVELADRPALIRGRACWNKMFRTEFWLGEAIEFPEVVRSNDIVPMTQALTAARSIDIVPDFVYLYRDRPGMASMTARASRVASLLSYLEQELICARLVVAHSHAEVINEYFSLFCQADGWVHLSKFRSMPISRSGDDGVQLDRAAHILDEILALVPKAAWARVPRARQRVYRLFADRYFDTLAYLDLDGNLGVGDAVASAASFELLVESAAVLRNYEPGEVVLFGDAVRYRLVDPLLEVAPTMPLEEISELAARVTAFQALIGPPDLSQPSASSELLRLCLAGDPVQIQQLARLHHALAFVARSVDHDQNSVRVLVGVEGLAEDDDLTLVLRLRGTNTVRTWGAVRRDTNRDMDVSTVTFVVMSPDVREVGTWDAWLRVASGGVSFERLLRVDHERARTPRARRAAFVVLEVTRPGNALVIVRRSIFAVRAAKRVLSRLGRGT